MFLSRVRTKGITLTELLVVLAIIGLIATIAVPTYLNRLEQARITTAKAEVEEIAKAQEILNATYGVYLPIQLLDDVPVSPSGSSTPPPDDFDNEPLSSLYAIDTSIPVYMQVGNQTSGAYDLDLSTTTNQKIVSMIENWAGPFLAPQRVYKGSATGSYPTSGEAIRRDFPLDPWKRPYRFFSPVGIIGARADVTDYDSDSFSNGELSTQDDRFDRFAIVSLGPDGLLDGTGSASSRDDVFYLFGSGETVYNP